MPRYRDGKLTKPMTAAEFSRLLQSSRLTPDKRSLLIFLFYSGVRVSEALRMRGRDFYSDDTNIYCHVGKRLKHGLLTKDLPIPLAARHVMELWDYVRVTPPERRVWLYGRKTAYRACRMLGFYPHYLRFNRATAFARAGKDLLKIKQWFGWAKAETAMSYLGELDIADMGEALREA